MARFAFAASAIGAAVLTGSAGASLTSTLIGDSYIVKEGAGSSARFYSVLDVYVKCTVSADIVSSTFGVSAFVSSYTMNQGDAFVQDGSTGANSAWLPVAGKASWDSFLTNGNRDQASASSTISLQLDTNWAPGNGTKIDGISGGAGWYPAVGANTSTNPYARAGYYNGASNTAKTASTIAGNNIAAGGSLDNAWMIGRFTIDVTGLESTAVKTVTMKFVIAGKNNGVTTVTGATNTAYRPQGTLTFAVPAPGAAALVGMAGLLVRRRSRA